MPFMALEEWLEGATYPFTIKTCSTSKQPNASTHLKPSGPCSSPGLSSPSPTSWIPKTDWVHTTLATGHPQTLRTIHHLYELNSGGPTLPNLHCLVSSSLPVPKQRFLTPYQWENWCHCPHHSDPGPTGFITDLPESCNNITYWYSKSLHLIPLPGLPTAFTTAELMFYHLFIILYFSIPEDIASEYLHKPNQPKKNKILLVLR